MRVNINAGGRDVTIETADTNVTPADIAARALDLWRATEGAKDDQGPAYGFVPSAQVARPRGYADFDVRPLEVQ
jgi:hypothetical protein